MLIAGSLAAADKLQRKGQRGETVQTMLDAEQPRRRWLVRLAALQACLVVAVVTLRQKPRPGTELLQHSLHPRELGYRAAKKRSGRAPGAALTTHLRAEWTVTKGMDPQAMLADFPTQLRGDVLSPGPLLRLSSPGTE